MKTTDFGFPSISAFDDDIKNTSKYSDYSNVVDNIMGNVETGGMTEEEIENLRSEVEDLVKERATELRENATWERADVSDDDTLGNEVVNDKSIDAIKDNFTPPSAKDEDEYELYDQMESMGDLPSDMQIHKALKKADTNDNGEIEVDEMADFQKSLDDYASKNKKGRDDIPVTTRR